MKTVIAVIAFTVVQGLIWDIANAATNNKIYLDQSGRQVDAQVAILKAAQGELTYACNPQEFKVSKSGNSISIRNKKKKLTKEEIAEQMKELAKRAE